jgi:hypothetical protein
MLCLITECILALSLNAGIDPNLVHALVKHESNYNPNAIGLVGEVGLLQIRPEYVPETPEQLKDPCTNLKRGIQLLKHARRYCKHQEDETWINCYNLGITGAEKVKYPKLFPYYKAVMANYRNK